MKSLLIAFGASFLTASLALAQPPGNEPGRLPEVPVVIEEASEDNDGDACGGSGVIEGLDPAGDGFLAVRSGPASNYVDLDRLYNGEEVYMCTQKGRWIGIVYSKKGLQCNVSSGWRTTAPYTGPCKSGWVHENWVRAFAG